MAPLKRKLRIIWYHCLFYWDRLYLFLSNLYKKLRIQEIVYFILFLVHRYSPRQFSTLHVFENVRMLVRKREWEGITASKRGEIRILSSGWERTLFAMKNLLLFGALQKRVEKVVFYTYLTLTLELNNPFNKELLMHFLNKKMLFLKRLLTYVKRINGKEWDRSDIEIHIEIFYRNSLLQAQVIENMERAVRGQKEPPIIRDAKEALKRGLNPLLITVGCSGAYWMRATNREIAGLFKPFDEEIHAPNNPIGPSMQGAMGQRKTRWGCRVGECAHHEVGAFLVDEFFGFGIVPRTYYASFSQRTFFLARENRMETFRKAKMKYGSFQEFVSGFESLDELSREERERLPLDEFQLLIVLDVIIGNTDRNMGNILVGEEKIAAIDHGLCFPDRIADDLSSWYWSAFELGKQSLLPSLVELLNNFPFETLSRKLKKRCFLPPEALHRMRERVVLFSEGVNGGLTPADLEGLMKPEYLFPLIELDSRLREEAKVQVAQYKQGLPKRVC